MKAPAVSRTWQFSTNDTYFILYAGMTYLFKSKDVGATSEYIYDIKYLPRMVMLYLPRW